MGQFLDANETFFCAGGSIAQWLPYMLLGPAALALIPGIPQIFSQEKIIDVARLINGAA